MCRQVWKRVRYGHHNRTTRTALQTQPLQCQELAAGGRMIDLSFMSEEMHLPGEEGNACAGDVVRIAMAERISSYRNRQRHDPCGHHSRNLRRWALDQPRRSGVPVMGSRNTTAAGAISIKALLRRSKRLAIKRLLSVSDSTDSIFRWP